VAGLTIGSISDYESVWPKVPSYPDAGHDGK